jgi:carbon monoxide dehydrogenase subunit G
MAIEIQEKFEVDAPIETVWNFMTNPETVVACLPGMTLQEVVDERNFVGKAKIKLGAMTMAYKGKIHFKDIDPANHILVMVAEGRDPSGGTVEGEISFRLVTLESGAIEVVTDAAISLTGKAMSVGAGMFKGISHQLFIQFANTAKKRLEAEVETAAAREGGNAEASESGEAQPRVELPMEEDVPLKIIPLLLKTLVAAIQGFIRRIFGGRANS